jgi:porphobilinogen synthase
MKMRKTPFLRDLVAEYSVHTDDLILPLFIKEGLKVKQPIPSMPGVFQLSLDDLKEEIEEIKHLKIKAVLLFGIPLHKDPFGSAALSKEGIIPQAIRLIKSYYPELVVIADLCLCEYTDHGHCGILNAHQEIDHKESLAFLGEQAKVLVEAGADIIAPSSRLDFMVGSLRALLPSTPIMSYTAKYASALYGPFRAAAEGAPRFGDRKSYQMDFRNKEEALLRAKRDLEEGADFIMVKPGHTYLDIVALFKAQNFHVPIVVYHTSGEYSLLKAGIAAGVIEEKAAFLEVLFAMKRAGAHLIITYFAKEYSRWFS